MTHFTLVAVLILGFGVSPQQGDKPAPFCECLTVDGAVEGLAQLRGANWRDIDRTRVKSLWPRVASLPCRAGAASGLEEAADYLARCLQACELCGGVVFDEDGSFRMVDIWVARQTPDAAKDVLRRLAAAARPAGVEVTSTSHSTSKTIDGYRWVSNGAPFMMRVEITEAGGNWIGDFRVGRCSSLTSTEAWQVAPDKTIRVFEAKTEERAGLGTVLSLSYATACLHEDLTCGSAELDQLWPRLRSLAAGRPIAAIDVDVEDCLGGSHAFQVTRSKDGRWRSVFWMPKTP